MLRKIILENIADPKFTDALIALVHEHYSKEVLEEAGIEMPFFAVLHCDMEEIKLATDKAAKEELALSILDSLNASESLWLYEHELVLINGFVYVKNTGEEV